MKIFIPLLLILLTSCLKDEANPNPNIYQSGVFSTFGHYETAPGRYEATVRVTLIDINGHPVEGKETYIEIPDTLSATPLSCISDADGRCSITLFSPNEVRAIFPVWVETDSVADSTTQASKKSSASWVKLVSFAAVQFYTTITVTDATMIDGQWHMNARARDYQGPVFNAPYHLEYPTGELWDSGTTDGSGQFSFSLPGDATQLDSCGFAFAGVEVSAFDCIAAGGK